MKKIELGQAITILANLGVIAGIAFLALEIQQNTRAVQAATLQGMLDIASTFAAEESRDPELIELMERARDDFGQLDSVEKARVRARARSQLLRYQGAYTQWQEEALSPAGWSIWEKSVCPAEPPNSLMANVWPLERRLFSDSFIAFFEGPDCRPYLENSTDQ